MFSKFKEVFSQYMGVVCESNLFELSMLTLHHHQEIRILTILWIEICTLQF